MRGRVIKNVFEIFFILRKNICFSVLGDLLFSFNYIGLGLKFFLFCEFFFEYILK